MRMLTLGVLTGSNPATAQEMPKRIGVGAVGWNGSNDKRPDLNSAIGVNVVKFNTRHNFSTGLTNQRRCGVKVVINTCFGGFGLSPIATKRMAELVGKKCYFFNGVGPYNPITLKQAEKNGLFYSAFSVPNPDEYLGDSHDTKNFNKRYEEISLYFDDIKRNDPYLIQVVEELGEKANGRCANLSIVEIPDGVEWEINQYDGNEHVEEKHRTWR